MNNKETYISINQLYKKFKGVVAVNDLSLNVYKGDIFGFLGPNGAGKSTTIRILLSLLKQDEGQVKIFNQSLKKNRNNILQRIGALVEKPDFYPFLSAYKNLELLAGYSTKKIEQRRIYEVLEFVGLKNRAKSKVKTYSQGMKQRLGIAQSLLHDPDLLILDEPGNGLDPQGTKEIRDLIIHLNKNEGKTIFLSSHLLNEVEQVANRMIIIDKGQAIIEGDVLDLLNTKELKVKFIVDDITKSLSQINNSKFKDKYEEHKGNEIKFLLENDEVAEVNKFFVNNDIKVEAIKPLRSLEEYFLKITNNII